MFITKSCPLCSIYSSGWIIFIFGTNDHYHYRVRRVLCFFQNLEIYNFWQIFEIFWPWSSKKNLQFSMNSFHILHKWSLVWEGVLHIMTFDLDLYLQRSFGLGLENRVRSVASTVLDGFFPYFVQTITSMRSCVACDELWPWPISSSSFDLDFENRVRSVTFSVLDWLFPCLPQIIITIIGCVTCYVYNKIISAL